MGAWAGSGYRVAWGFLLSYPTGFVSFSAQDCGVKRSYVPLDGVPDDMSNLVSPENQAECIQRPPGEFC